MNKPFAKHDIIGAVEVLTFCVTLKNVYVTLATTDSQPFDMTITDNADDAGKAHAKFIATARLLEAVTPAIKTALDKGEKPDVESIVAGILPPKGTLLN